MVYNFDDYNYIVRLQKGEQLMQSLQQFVSKTNTDGAWVNGLGGATEFTIGYYNLNDKQYHWKTVTGLHEVTSVQGNIALGEDGKPIFHLHGTFAGPDYQTIGGHIKDLTAGATLELFIHRTYQPLHRKPDPEVGLPVLDLGSA